MIHIHTWCEATSQCQRKWEDPCVSDGFTVGDDLDMYGCVSSAGYTWCEGESKCYRSWEDTCSDAMTLGSDSDENNCIASAGYTWCEEKSKCLRTWEEECASMMNSDVPTTTSPIDEAVGKVLKRISVGGWVAIVCAILAICALVVVVTMVITRKRTQKQCAEASMDYKEILVDDDHDV